MKFTTPRLDIHQNAAELMQHPPLVYPTLYASSLITLNKSGYTKHYYEGSNRICSKIGGGFGNVDWDVVDSRIQPVEQASYDELHDRQQEGLWQTFSQCLHHDPEIMDHYDLRMVLDDYEKGRDDSEPAFYYHSDHLGSAAYLTNDAGQVTQTLNYLPYGEDWVDIQNFAETLYPRLGIYTFNGKEKDYESGYHYYGARYYWSELLTGWLIVDPMMDKYPSMSPYNYCAWNPVNVIDPDGREMTDFKNAKGNVVKHIDDNQDVVYQEVGSGYFRHYEYQSGNINSSNIDYQTTLVAQEQQQLNLDNSKLEKNTQTGDTYCNFATQNILNAVGSIPGNNNANVPVLLANQMVDWFDNNNNFVNVSQSEAASFADAGHVSVVGAKAKSHGHVATLTVGANRSSSQQYANVGLKNGYMNFSDIFSTKYQQTHDIKHYVYFRGNVLPTVTITAERIKQ